MKENMLAFVDFVRDNPDAMEEVTSVGQGIEILNALAESIPVSRLVPMTHNSLFGDRLLLHLNSLVAGTKDAQEFHRAVAELSADFIGVAWEIETIDRVLAEADIRDLIEHCPALLDGTHPWRGKVNLDPYWEWRVRRYLVRGDYRRTWDELNKARRGFAKTEKTPLDTIDRLFQQSQKSEMIGEVLYEGRHSYACSKTMLATLISDLFTAMVEKGLVATITEADTKLDGSITTHKVFETKPTKGGRTIRSYDQWVTVAGFGFACIFRIQAGRAYAGHGKFHIFDETGAQVLKIAAYFRKKKDEQRQKRHDDAVSRQMSESKIKS